MSYRPALKPVRETGRQQLFKSAVLFGNKDELKSLLAGYESFSDIDINKIFGNIQNVNALMYSSENNNENIVKILLEKGADVNIQNNEGDTALMLASYNGHTSIVKLLLEAGAEKNLTNKQGKTAYDLASKSEIKDLLKAKEKKINIPNTTVASVNEQPTYRYEPNEQLNNQLNNNQNTMGGKRRKKTRKAKHKKNKSRKH